MPCVFPVLFLKALALVNSANASAAHQRRHGIAYTFGILCSFWIIVAALLVLRVVGKEAGWGFQLQSPGIVVAITFLMFFMALSLAGMFDLGLTLTSAGDGLTRKEGRLCGLLLHRRACYSRGYALYCTTDGSGDWFCPFPECVHYVRSVHRSCSWPGVAVPLAHACAGAGQRSSHGPEAGWKRWKQLTAIPLFLTTVWLIWVYGQLDGTTPGDASDHIARLLAGLVILAIAGWILGRWPARRWGYVAAILVAVAGFAVPLSAGRSRQLAMAALYERISSSSAESGQAGLR